jgi:dTDP-4-dehydrorhamnose reductase
MNDTKPKILVTGGSGFLGFFLLPILKKHFNIVALYNTQKPNYYSTINWLSVDLENENALQQFLKTHRFDFIVHLAAIATIQGVESNKDKSEKINVLTTQLLTNHAKQNNIPLLFTSTDMVFCGKEKTYNEDSCAKPKNLYGLQKLSAEKFVLEFDKGIVLRLPLLLGYSPYHKLQGVIYSIINANNNSSIVNSYTNEYRSVAWVFDIAKFIVLVAKSFLNFKIPYVR